MQSAIAQISARLETTDICDVQVTDVDDDGAGGLVRAVKFFGEPAASAGPVLVLEVRIRSERRADLDITTPSLAF